MGTPRSHCVLVEEQRSEQRSPARQFRCIACFAWWKRDERSESKQTKKGICQRVDEFIGFYLRCVVSDSEIGKDLDNPLYVSVCLRTLLQSKVKHVLRRPWFQNCSPAPCDHAIPRLNVSRRRARRCVYRESPWSDPLTDWIPVFPKSQDPACIDPPNHIMQADGVYTVVLYIYMV